MRIIELPFEFCDGQKLPLAVLLQRPSVASVRHDIYLGENYDFTGAVEADTYQLLAAHHRFAQHGSVVQDYPADTFTIDQELGIVIQIDGVDTTIPELNAFNALNDELLLFAGDEIMSVISAQLVAAHTYRLKVIRGRMATDREAQVAGTEIYLVRREDIRPLTHKNFQVENTIALKVVTSTGNVTQDIADVDAVEHTITGSLFTQTAPLNLRVNGEWRNASYPAATDLRIDWSLHELRASIAAQFGVKLRTKVEILAGSDSSVLYSKRTYGERFKIAAAKMATILLAETSFVVRITGHVLGSNLQLETDSQQLTVNVI